MYWDVIYSYDGTKSLKIRDHAPDKHAFRCTEFNDQYDYDYLADESDSAYMQNEYKHGKHRKYCGQLSDKQFRKFIDYVLLPSYVELTAGMIGAPSGGYGWTPALALSCESSTWMHMISKEAYVMPYPDNKSEENFLKSMDESELRKWIEESYL